MNMGMEYRVLEEKTVYSGNGWNRILQFFKLKPKQRMITKIQPISISLIRGE